MPRRRETYEEFIARGGAPDSYEGGAAMIDVRAHPRKETRGVRQHIRRAWRIRRIEPDTGYSWELELPANTFNGDQRFEYFKTKKDALYFARMNR